MTKKNMMRCSTSLSSREMQIKTTMKHHLTPVRMAIIKKSINSKSEVGASVSCSILSDSLQSHGLDCQAPLPYSSIFYTRT